jgi:isochorismate pyruvate lyase
MKQSKKCSTIQEVRTEIDRIDRQVIALFGERFEYVKEIVRFKSNEEEVAAKPRYDEVLKVRRKWAEENGINPDVVESIYKTLMQYFIDEQMKMLKEKKS